MSPPMSVNARDTQNHIERQLEVTVLTQIRDSMALMNANITKLNDKVENTNDRVIQLQAANYDEQIKRLELEFKEDLLRTRDEFQRQLGDVTVAVAANAERLGSQSVQLARLGLGMAISATVGGTALGAVIIFLITRLLGGH